MWNFSFFILRPAIAWALNLFILVFGTVSLFKLPLEGDPKIRNNNITITGSLSGTQTPAMRHITEILEACVSSTPGLEYYESSTVSGTSLITAVFSKSATSAHMNAAVIQIMQALQNSDRLPRSMRKPKLQAGGSETENIKVLKLAIYSKDNKSDVATEIKRLTLARYIKSQITAINGVSDCTGAESSLRAILYLDPELMHDYNVSYSNVYNILHDRHNHSAGDIIEAQYTQSIQMGTGLPHTIPEILSTLIPTVDNKNSVPLSAFAKLDISAHGDEKNTHYINGRDAIILEILCSAQGNPTTISKQAKEIISKFQENEKDFELVVFDDAGKVIEEDLYGLLHTILLTTVIVLSVIFVFLGSLRATFITLCVLPFSIIGTFTFLYILGLTINNYTLLALTIAIGLCVDDAIIMCEIIHTYIERGLSPLQAAISGIKEIQKALIATTFTLAATFLPAMFTGVDQRELYEFALTLSIAVIISGFVALVLTPTMCANFLKAHHQNIQPDRVRLSAVKSRDDMLLYIRYVSFYAEKYIKSILTAIESSHQAILYRLLVFRYYVLFAFMPIITGISYILLLQLPRMAPVEAPDVISVSFLMPGGASLSYCENRVKAIEQILAPYSAKYAQLMYSSARAGRASSVGLYLPPLRYRKHGFNAAALEAALREQTRGIVPGIAVSSLTDKSDRRTDKTLEFIIFGRSEVAELHTLAVKATRILSGLTIFSAPPQISRQFENHEFYNIKMNDRLCQEYSVNPYHLSILPAKHGSVYANIEYADQQVEVCADLLQLGAFEYRKDTWVTSIPATDISDPKINPLPRSTPDTLLNSLYIETRHKDHHNDVRLEKLSRFAEITTISAPKAIYRYKGQNAAFISGALAPGVGYDEAYKVVQNAIKPLLKSGLILEPYGDAKESQESQGTFMNTALIAIICVFLFLVIIYESFIDPIITFFCIPLALFGGLSCLWMYGGSFDVKVQIGILTLIGMIIKHGIIIIEVSNAYLASGISLNNAALFGVRDRLRPILMTTLAMAFGMIELLFSDSSSANALKEMAIFIIAGLSIGTFLIIFVIPCAYYVIKSFAMWLRPQGNEIE